MLALANERLGAAGYLYIGMDHFVRPDDELALAQARGQLQRNFQGYSTSLAQDLVGLGVSAIGSTPDGYAQNAKALNDYYRHLDRGELPIERGLRLNTDDRIRRHVIMQLICNLQLDVAAAEALYRIDFREYFQAEWPRLEQLAADGLIDIETRRLTVTAAGRPLVRNICMVFDHYLGTVPQTRYSKAL